MKKSTSQPSLRDPLDAVGVVGRDAGQQPLVVDRLDEIVDPCRLCPSRKQVIGCAAVVRHGDRPGVFDSLAKVLAPSSAGRSTACLRPARGAAAAWRRPSPRAQPLVRVDTPRARTRSRKATVRLRREVAPHLLVYLAAKIRVPPWPRDTRNLRFVRDPKQAIVRLVKVYER